MRGVECGMALGLCNGCRRFVRTGKACAFCGGVVAETRPRPRRRMARNALVAATASLVVACSSHYGGPPIDPGDGADDDVDYGQPLYGAGWVDSGGDTRDAAGEADARSEAEAGDAKTE